MRSGLWPLVAYHKQRSKCWPTFAQHRNGYWTDTCAWKYLNLPGLHVMFYFVLFFLLMSSLIFMKVHGPKWVANDIWLPRVIFSKGTTCWCLFGYSTIPSMVGFCILEMESQAEGLGCLNVLLTPWLSLWQAIILLRIWSQKSFVQNTGSVFATFRDQPGLISQKWVLSQSHDWKNLVISHLTGCF